MVGVICDTNCASPDNDMGRVLSEGSRTGATTTVVVVTETTRLRGEALAEAAINAAVAIGETSVLLFRLRDDSDAAGARFAAGAGLETAGLIAAGLEVRGVVAVLTTAFLTVLTGLSAPTVFGVTLFFIAILYKTESASIGLVNEMAIKTVQSSERLTTQTPFTPQQ